MTIPQALALNENKLRNNPRKYLKLFPDRQELRSSSLIEARLAGLLDQANAAASGARHLMTGTKVMLPVFALVLVFGAGANTASGDLLSSWLVVGSGFMVLLVLALALREYAWTAPAASKFGDLAEIYRDELEQLRQRASAAVGSTA